ncbi:hypothetical protein NA56DRAFT_649673 [Hyaloscypha hepaticicola]|uniref:Rhodopsin domain-containing protein n=1 Tax=Hyaloscypha hepaticicola TaxID=2082293 RepID=A0A2J6PPX1_9HELO|nr:hypothetical protein NA56DRAFT_649673 [Hyaloscypha hepaticicola]
MALVSSNPPTGDLQPNLHAAVIVTPIIAIIAVGLRFLARRLVHASMWLDDWLTLVALAMTIGFDVNIFFVIKSGTGLHLEAINRPTILIYHDFFLCLWIGELFYTFALAPAKLAFLAFYWRIFGVSSIRMPVKILATAVTLWSFIRIVVTLCHCTPVEAYWDKTIQGNCPINDQKYFVGSVIAHLFMDLTILALPVPYIKSLNISFYQKFCVFAMFLFGGFICFATIIQIIICFKLNVTSPDVTWNFALMALWATVEVNLAVTAVCLPSLRPIYRLVVDGSLKSTQRSAIHSASWNDRSNHQTRNTLKKDFSDSTQQLAGLDADGGRSFTEGLEASSRGSGTICEMDNLSPLAPEGKHGIMVKSEVDVQLSARN